MSDLEFSHFPNHRKRSCAEPGSSEKRKPSHRTQRWEITCNLSTLPRAPSTASAVSPGSRPHPPPQKRGTRSTAKESASLGLADELCKLQKLNRGHTTCPSQQRREEGGLGRIPTLLGRGWGRWRRAPLLRLQELPPPEVCSNSSIPPPGPPRSCGGKKDPKDGGAGGLGGQLKARSGPACTLRAPGVRKRTIADPRSPKPSASPARACLPSSSKFSAEAGRVQNRGSGGARLRADRAGGTGSGLGVPRTPRRRWGG